MADAPGTSIVPPNFVVIMSDQHNPHILGCAGDPWVRTPSLDRLARDGVRFASTYCAHPLCVPSRMAFMTGLFPKDLAIWTNGGILSPDMPTFAHAFNAAGYETVLCGRMHFVGPDQNHGFRQRLVGDVSGAIRDIPETGLFEGVWSPRSNGQTADTLAPETVGPGRATYEVYDEAVTRRACEWLIDRAGGTSPSPFLLVIGFLLPHNPYVCAPDLFDEYMRRLPPLAPDESGYEHPAIIEWRQLRGLDRVTNEWQQRARAAYYGLVTTLDTNVGRILEALDRTGLRRTTHVVYTSDHGDLCGEHGMWWKDSFYDGAAGVPLIWSPAPGGDGRSEDHAQSLRVRIVREPRSLLDVAPTLLDFAGGPGLPGARGRSLREDILGNSPAEAEENVPEGGREVFVEDFAHGRPGRMIRHGRWKLCAWDGWERVQLFDMENDPEERRDLGLDPGFETLRRDLRGRVLEDWSPEDVRERHAQRMAHQGLVYGQGRLSPGGTVSEQWEFPRGVNVRG